MGKKKKKNNSNKPAAPQGGNTAAAAATTASAPAKDRDHYTTTHVPTVHRPPDAAQDQTPIHLLAKQEKMRGNEDFHKVQQRIHPLNTPRAITPVLFTTTPRPLHSPLGTHHYSCLCLSTVLSLICGRKSTSRPSKTARRHCNWTASA